MGIRVRWESASVVGHVRQKNEDAWGVRALADRSDLLLAVADGMGGLPGGEIASRLAVEACLAAFDRESSAPQDPRDLLAKLIEAARARLSGAAERDATLVRMGTTLTLLLLREDGGWLGHLGDSRLLWCRDRSIALVTQDHSAAWPWVAAGRMTPEQAERDPLGSVLTRHLGPAIPCEPDIPGQPLDLRAGDRLLLCTDGLGKVVSMERIVALCALAIAESVEGLVREALQGGGPDNITVVLAEVIDPPKAEIPPFTFESCPHRWSVSS
jgi:protein phosphatase